MIYESCFFSNNENDLPHNEEHNYYELSEQEKNEEEKDIEFNKYDLIKDNSKKIIANNKINEVGTKETTLGFKNNNGEKLNLFKNKLINNNFLSNEDEKQKINELNINKGYSGKKRGRGGNSGDHNKFSDDNLRRKCKHLVLKYLLYFLNNIIRSFYHNYIGCGINVKKLLTINQKQKSDATIQFNKDFLSKTIGDIFSDDISTRYTNYPLSHNKNLILYLTNHQDENKKQYFKKLFNLTFLDCLQHFRGSKYIEELNHLKRFDEIKSEYENEPDYLKSLSYYIMNFEQIINRKRTRKNKIK